MTVERRLKQAAFFFYSPSIFICRSANELLRNLSAQGLITPDALQLGIEADPQTGAVVNINGKKSETILHLVVILKVCFGKVLLYLIYVYRHVGWLCIFQGL